MRTILKSWVWAALIAVLALAGAAEAGGPFGFGRRVPTCPGPACGHVHCGHDRPCATFYQVNCKPLPPISFSRYVENGDYDCTRCVYGDAIPHCPWFWYAYRQPYPVPHEFGVQSEESQGGSGRGREF